MLDVLQDRALDAAIAAAETQRQNFYWVQVGQAVHSPVTEQFGIVTAVLMDSPQYLRVRILGGDEHLSIWYQDWCSDRWDVYRKQIPLEDDRD